MLVFEIQQREDASDSHRGNQPSILELHSSLWRAIVNLVESPHPSSVKSSLQCLKTLGAQTTLHIVSWHYFALSVGYENITLLSYRRYKSIKSDTREMPVQWSLGFLEGIQRTLNRLMGSKIGWWAYKERSIGWLIPLLSAFIEFYTWFDRCGYNIRRVWTLHKFKTRSWTLYQNLYSILFTPSNPFQAPKEPILSSTLLSAESGGTVWPLWFMKLVRQ